MPLLPNRGKQEEGTTRFFPRPRPRHDSCSRKLTKAPVVATRIDTSEWQRRLAANEQLRRRWNLLEARYREYLFHRAIGGDGKSDVSRLEWQRPRGATAPT